eukprot:scaffold52780_cov45-Phaeocystis_antarctica.AAC.1
MLFGHRVFSGVGDRHDQPKPVADANCKRGNYVATGGKLQTRGKFFYKSTRAVLVFPAAAPDGEGSLPAARIGDPVARSSAKQCSELGCRALTSVLILVSRACDGYPVVCAYHGRLCNLCAYHTTVDYFAPAIAAMLALSVSRPNAMPRRAGGTWLGSGLGAGL